MSDYSAFERMSAGRRTDANSLRSPRALVSSRFDGSWFRSIDLLFRSIDLLLSFKSTLWLIHSHSYFFSSMVPSCDAVNRRRLYLLVLVGSRSSLGLRSITYLSIFNHGHFFVLVPLPVDRSFGIDPFLLSMLLLVDSLLLSIVFG